MLPKWEDDKIRQIVGIAMVGAGRFVFYVGRRFGFYGGRRFGFTRANESDSTVSDRSITRKAGQLRFFLYEESSSIMITLVIIYNMYECQYTTPTLVVIGNDDSAT